MPTRTTPEHGAELQKAVPGGRAQRAQDPRAGKRIARRELVLSAPRMYVYQAKIDSTGVRPKREHDVFAASESTIDELVALCNTIVHDHGISRVFVAADHASLDTRWPLKEHAKIAMADTSSGADQPHGGHILSGGASVSNIREDMNKDDTRGGEDQGLAMHECISLKSVASNKNYVQGGVSLQGMCVPVIEARNLQSKSKARVDQGKATLSLVSTRRRITKTTFLVDKYQHKPGPGQELPSEKALRLTDGSGKPVTDTQKAHADISTPDERARVSGSKFTLKAGLVTPPDERDSLVCRDMATNEITRMETFTTNMAFAPSVDDGF